MKQTPKNAGFGLITWELFGASLLGLLISA
jgi:hypothetical protein